MIQATSHDMKSPISAMKFIIENLLNDNTTNKEEVLKLKALNFKLHSIVTDMVDYSQLKNSIEKSLSY